MPSRAHGYIEIVRREPGAAVRAGILELIALL
jgi:hypothetical protein